MKVKDLLCTKTCEKKKRSTHKYKYMPQFFTITSLSLPTTEEAKKWVSSFLFFAPPPLQTMHHEICMEREPSQGFDTSNSDPDGRLVTAGYTVVHLSNSYVPREKHQCTAGWEPLENFPIQLLKRHGMWHFLVLVVNDLT